MCKSRSCSITCMMVANKTKMVKSNRPTPLHQYPVAPAMYNPSLIQLSDVLASYPRITLTSKYIAWSMPFLTCTLLSLSLSLVCAQFPWLLPSPHAHQGRVPGRLRRVPRCTFCCAGHDHPSGLLPALLRPWCHSYRVRQKQNGRGWLLPNLTTSVLWNI